jgi:hypothetical protein
MVRAWWKAIFPPWIAAWLPLWLAVLLATGSAPAWAWLALWWAKPLADRLPLFVASRALFGAIPKGRETLAALPRLLARGALSALSRERFDPARSFRLPIRQLEGLSGGERRTRSKVLGREGRETAALLTFVCLMLEILLFFALLALVGLLLPGPLEPDWGELAGGYLAGRAPLGFHLGLGLGWFVAVTLVEPFYAVAGFALYLNRRTLLEGWDVEIAFRRLARRLREEPARIHGGRSAAALLLASLLGLGTAAGASAPAPAGANGDRPVEVSLGSQEAAPEDREAQRRMAEILAQPEFETRRKVKRLEWRGPDLSPDGGDTRRFSLPLGFVGALLEGALWVLLAVLLAAGLAYLLRLSRDRGAGGKAARPPPAPTVLFGLTVAPDALPADVAGEALRRLEAGRPVEALSLLFRGALAHLVSRRGLEVRPSWTEGECLRRLAGRLGEAGGEYLERLTRAWQGAAYAHRLPAADELRSLCFAWQSHFGAAP